MTPGPAALPSLTTSAFASTQAAWRFYRNPEVTLPRLVAPLHQAARDALQLCPAPFALVVIDWSTVNYHSHLSKTDQVLFSQGSDRGYELASALLVDTTAGDPLAPLELRLRTADAVYSTRQPAPPCSASHLDQVLPTMRSLAGLALPTALVYVIDCEADSVDHLRQWHRQRQLFLVRTDGTRKARFEGSEHTLKEIDTLLRRRGAFAGRRVVRYHGQPAVQTVAEVEVVLERPANRREGDKRRVIHGKPLRLRLVISLVQDAEGKVLATWYLLTNLAAEVDTAEVALWYYWRWRIESFFKLLKSAGQQLESWQQETGGAVARRLAVACMACVAVWRLAGAEGEEAQTLRQLLIRLSGRQMKHGVSFTLPALLAGAWVMLAMLEVLDQFDLEEVRRLAGPLRRTIPPHPTDSG